MNGKLYIVATPIGNLEDITLRAIKVLNEVDIIAAEDTRHSLKLLNHLQISKPLISYHRHNEEAKTETLIEKLKEGNNIALISDAGTPVISDPGEDVVREAIRNEIQVIPIPGACAAICALISSGLDSKEFYFMGFLPINKKNRKEKLKEIQEQRSTVIIYEAPHKLRGTMEELKDIIQERKVVLVKELTKIHENYYRGTLDEVIEKTSEQPKGEYILLIEGKKENNTSKDKWDKLTIEEHYSLYERQGYSKKEIIKKIAKDRGVNKNEIYMYFLHKK